MSRPLTDSAWIRTQTSQLFIGFHSQTYVRNSMRVKRANEIMCLRGPHGPKTQSIVFSRMHNACFCSDRRGRQASELTEEGWWASATAATAAAATTGEEEAKAVWSETIAQCIVCSKTWCHQKKASFPQHPHSTSILSHRSPQANGAVGVWKDDSNLPE